MASIVMRNKPAVAFRYRGSDGNVHQERITCQTVEEAQVLLEEVNRYEKSPPAILTAFAEVVIPERYPNRKSRCKKRDLSVETIGTEWISHLLSQKDSPLAPNTLNCYRRVFFKHILVFFKDKKVTDITGVNIIEFKNWLIADCGLKRKSATKYVNILNLLLRHAVMAGYLSSVPVYFEDGNRKSKKITSGQDDEEVKGWDFDTAIQFIDAAKDDLSPECVVVELTLSNSLRNGECAGIPETNVNLALKYIDIDRELQRIEDSDSSVLQNHMVFYQFDKIQGRSKSTLMLISPKTDKSIRRIYPPESLCKKIQYLMNRNAHNKAMLGSEYNDAGLLFCFNDGRPMEPTHLNKVFHQLQDKYGIPKEKQINFQGLRRTGQKIKMDLSGYNAKLVADMGGHSTTVLQSNYNFSNEEDMRKVMDKYDEHVYKNNPNNII